MKASDVYTVIEAIQEDEARAVPRESIEFLAEEGFLAVKSAAEYEGKQAAMAEAAKIATQLHQYNQQIREQESTIEDLKEKQDSTLHKLWSALKHQGSRGMMDEQEQLARASRKLSTLTDQQKIAREKKEQLGEIKDDLTGFIKTADSYVRLHENTEELMENLSQRLPRLKGVDFNDFEQELISTQVAIDDRYKRFMDVYEFLTQDGLPEDTNVRQFAINLSAMAGTVQDLDRKYKFADDMLMSAFEDDYGYNEDPKRLKIIMALMNTPGNLDNNIHKLEKLFRIAQENDHDNSYGTLFEQALCLRIPLGKAREKFRRFDNMMLALDDHGWEYNTSSACYLAAHLAQKEGSTSKIASSFRNLEMALVNKGIDDCPASGMAALTLFDAPGSEEQKADRFITAYNEMLNHGWDDAHAYYASAAILSLMPGTNHENVHLLYDVATRLDADGFTKNRTALALPIIGGGYRQRFKIADAEASSASSHSSSSYQASNYDDSDDFGFNTTSAILGDLMDDGSINLSGGFALGGLTGLFD